MLKTLETGEICRFLNEFAAYEDQLKAVYGLPNATLQRSIGYQTLADLKELVVDITDRESTLAKLKDLSGVYHAARMAYLEQKVKSDVVWVNKWHIP